MRTSLPTLALMTVLCVLLPWPLTLSAQNANGASALASAIDREAAAVEQQMLTWRRHLHQNPELSNREVETAKYVADALRGLGLQPQTGVAKHGVVAILQGGRPG